MNTKLLDFLRLGSLSLSLLLVTSVSGLAATGNELLMSSVDGADLNKGAIPCKKLLKAVAKVVAENPGQAPEIVGAAMLKTADCETCARTLIATAINALGENKLRKGLIPRIVGMAIKARPNSCECASSISAEAISALGKNPPEELVADILREALAAASADCTGRLVDAITLAAPQYADTLTDLAARIAKGEINVAENPVADSTGEPVPAPFVFPASGGGGISAGEVTPVN